MNGPAEIPFCPEPFTFLSREMGRFSTCCPGWMDESRFLTGEFDNLWEVWNDPRLVELRRALLNRDYRWCQRCPARFKPRDRHGPRPDETPVMARPPITYQVQSDSRCNLRCLSCRSHLITDAWDDAWPLRKVVKQMPGIKTVAVSLGGDPFASEDCRSFLMQSGPPDAILWTNGLLLPSFWHRIRRRVSVIVMSIDAARPETYERLRVPGKWENLVRALTFIRDLVAGQHVALFQTNFVVQGANWREMAKFVEMSKRYLAHTVQFAPIAPWPHITAEQWAAANVSDLRHPDHHAYLCMLKHPTLQQPGVDCGLLSTASLGMYGQSEAGQNFWFDPSWQAS